MDLFYQAVTFGCGLLIFVMSFLFEDCWYLRAPVTFVGAVVFALGALGLLGIIG